MFLELSGYYMQIYPAHRTQNTSIEAIYCDTVSRLVKIKCWHGKCSVLIDGKSTKFFSKNGRKEYGLQVGCFNNRNNNNNKTKTAILDRHLRISRGKGKTNVHGKTNCPFMALRLRYTHGNHKC